MYGVPFSHVFTELQISPIELHIIISNSIADISNSIADIYNSIGDISKSAYFEISAIELEISSIQLQISPNTPICRYLQFN